MICCEQPHFEGGTPGGSAETTPPRCQHRSQKKKSCSRRRRRPPRRPLTDLGELTRAELDTARRFLQVVLLDENDLRGAGRPLALVGLPPGPQRRIRYPFVGGWTRAGASAAAAASEHATPPQTATENAQWGPHTLTSPCSSTGSWSYPRAAAAMSASTTAAATGTLMLAS